MARFLLALTLLGLALSTIPRSDATERPPNILFLLADDMRPDAVATLGNPHIRTPHLDAFAERGMTFSRATCSYPICVVVRAEMLTGRHGWENGVSGLTGSSFHPDQPFWAETLRDGGYETWHVGKWHVSGRPSTRGYTDVAGHFGSGGGRYWEEGQRDWKGFPITGFRGWIFQSDDGKTLYPELGVGLTPDISAIFADAAISLIEREPTKPWFCQVNFAAPHDPLLMPTGMEGKYRSEDIPLPSNYLPVHPFDHGNFAGRDEALLAWPRTEEAVRDLLRMYYSVIEDLDEQIGRILAALEESGQLENTIVVFSSDNGMACGSHGLRGKQNMYEHSINVPFFIAGPGIRPGSQTDAQIYLRDLYPTTCELAGIPIPETVTARSFLPVLRGESDVHHENIFGYFTDTQRMIRTSEGWKLIHYPHLEKWQLFDLNEDPDELHDLATTAEGIPHPMLPRLREDLRQWRVETGDPLLPGDPLYEIDLSVATQGFDPEMCWVHARAGAIPPDTSANAASSPLVVMTLQKLQLSGSDVFYALNEMRSPDRGETWTAPFEHESFARQPFRWKDRDDLEITVCDFWPKWHAASETLLGIGHTVVYENNAVMKTRPRGAAYAAYDPSSHSWSDWRILEMPDDPKFGNSGAGCVQRVDLENGEILLPVYFKAVEEAQNSVTVVRCSFDGSELRYLEHGTELTVPIQRGLYEPSLTKWGGKFYLTMRNDEHGYNAVSEDGLTFSEPEIWRFDDGEELGTYNTQQHWVNHPESLFLVYTRRGANNDHVMRHRAPLFIARVDAETRRIVRASEQILVPEYGARLGNFGVTEIGPDETWVTAAEWMQGPPPHYRDAGRLAEFGADNRVWVARLKWKTPIEP